MEKQKYIVFIESDTVSLFIAQQVLIPYEEFYPISYFTNIERALNFIGSLETTKVECLHIFVNSHVLNFDGGLADLIKNYSIKISIKLFLLTSSPKLLKQEEMTFNKVPFTGFVEKPLTDAKFRECLHIPLNSSSWSGLISSL